MLAPIRIDYDHCDISFCRALTKENMIGYIERHWGKWNDAIFNENFMKTKNGSIFYNQSLVGFVRIIESDRGIKLDDIQIKGDKIGHGIGTSVIKLLQDTYDFIQLRVFLENPALNLYKKFGFFVVANHASDETVEMKWLKDKRTGLTSS
jgi:hypothetical protein